MLEIGENFSRSTLITDELVRRFAELSGDFNPIHLDENFAAGTRFKRRIAHGMLTGALISGVIGDQLRERKIVYLSQTMNFIAPVFIGDTVTVNACVTHIRQDKPVITLEITCRNQDDATVVEGEGKIMLLEQKN